MYSLSYMYIAEAADIVNLDQLYFNFECFTEGETAYIFDILAQGNDCLEGPETIGFTLGESSNVPGAMAFGNTVEIVINDAGKVDPMHQLNLLTLYIFMSP